MTYNSYYDDLQMEKQERMLDHEQEYQEMYRPMDLRENTETPHSGETSQ